MATQTTDPAKLATQIARLEKFVDALSRRVLALEQENKKLRGRIGRATEQIGYGERKLASSLASLQGSKR